MNLKVIEGRLTETPVGAGVERRAYGEFVGPRGELASYAFGWTTESERHVARLTVGIGAGNPDGASFHAIVFDNEGSYACSLVDEPFDRVPEGGPDLTASKARAHEDLPFIWWVVDRVMERDRRARWMKHWLLGTTSIQTSEVFERTEPILSVSHDADDGRWQLIGASDANPATGRLSHLHHAVLRCSTYSTSNPARALHGPDRTTPGPASPPETGEATSRVRLMAYRTRARSAA